MCSSRRSRNRAMTIIVETPVESSAVGFLAGQARHVVRLLAPVPLQTLCLRHEPEGLAGEALDRHTLGWAEAINRSGRAYLTPAILDGRWMVRVSIGAEATEQVHVARLWAWMREEAAG